MSIAYDPRKRAWTLEMRGLDFDEAVEVFDGLRFEIEDVRRDYGEPRHLCYGYLRGRFVVIGYTWRDGTRRIFSMRKANAREEARFASKVGL